MDVAEIRVASVDTSTRAWHSRRTIRDVDVAAMAGSMDNDYRNVAPIVVRPSVRPGFDWEVVAGRVRLLAAIKLGWEWILALPSPMDDGEARLTGLRENCSRTDLTPLEFAWAIGDVLSSWDGTQTALAEAIGVADSAVSEGKGVARALPEDLALEIAEAAGLSVDALFDLTRPALRKLKGLKNREAVRSALLAMITVNPEQNAGAPPCARSEAVEPQLPESSQRSSATAGDAGGFTYAADGEPGAARAQATPISSSSGPDLREVAGLILKLSLSEKLSVLWMVFVAGFTRLGLARSDAR